MREALERVGLFRSASPRPRHRLCSIREFDNALFSAGLRKVAGSTLGFGPFTFMGCPLFTGRTGIAIHHFLQGLADRGFRGLRSTGVEYIVLCQKPCPSS